MSSLVGAIFGAVAIAVAIPISPASLLSFGSPEFFMLSHCWGFPSCAALSGEDVLKGIGLRRYRLMFATIGSGSDIRHTALHFWSAISGGTASDSSPLQLASTPFPKLSSWRC